MTRHDMKVTRLQFRDTQRANSATPVSIAHYYYKCWRGHNLSTSRFDDGDDDGDNNNLVEFRTFNEGKQYAETHRIRISTSLR